eukprot:gene13141-biopygen4384
MQIVNEPEFGMGSDLRPVQRSERPVRPVWKGGPSNVWNDGRNRPPSPWTEPRSPATASPRPHSPARYRAAPPGTAPNGGGSGHTYPFGWFPFPSLQCVPSLGLYGCGVRGDLQPQWLLRADAGIPLQAYRRGQRCGAIVRWRDDARRGLAPALCEHSLRSAVRNPGGLCVCRLTCSPRPGLFPNSLRGEAGGMRGCCAAVVARAARESDSVEERRRKETFLPVWLALAAFMFPWAVRGLLSLKHVFDVGIIVMFLAAVAQGVPALALRRYPLPVLEAGEMYLKTLEISCTSTFSCLSCTGCGGWCSATTHTGCTSAPSCTCATGPTGATG